MHFNVLITINVQRHFVQSPFLMQTHSGTSRMLDFGRRPGHVPPCSGDSSKGSWRGGEGTPGVLWGRGGTVRLGTGQPGLPCRRAAAHPLQVPDPGWPAGPGARGCLPPRGSGWARGPGALPGGGLPGGTLDTMASVSLAGGACTLPGEASQGCSPRATTDQGSEDGREGALLWRASPVHRPPGCRP